jgi:GxxExxY protein
MGTNLRIRKRIIQREDLVYPELSYQIVGILFEVYNELGYGFDEKVYQKAIAIALKNAKLIFKEQVYTPLIYGGKTVGRNYFDFLIDGKIVLEIKRGDRFSKAHIDQMLEYLHTSKLKLGILAYFSPSKLHYKRLVNL